MPYAVLLVQDGWKRHHGDARSRHPLLLSEHAVPELAYYSYEARHLRSLLPHRDDRSGPFLRICPPPSDTLRPRRQRVGEAPLRHRPVVLLADDHWLVLLQRCR